MRQREHLGPQTAVDLLIVESGFRGGHGVLQAVEKEIRDRFNDDFILAANKCFKINPNISGDSSYRLLVCEITTDGVDARRKRAG
ncbi:hypothetical protein SDC9_192065 [bioreactor metagenome]|uniref:Uncharacterized protein n=1 Tax=bioreactor metagenome TaxID=1076179 RepID=A0A645HZZ8_9ZZZZ